MTTGEDDQNAWKTEGRRRNTSSSSSGGPGRPEDEDGRTTPSNHNARAVVDSHSPLACSDCTDTSRWWTAASIDAGLAFARYGDATGQRRSGRPRAPGTLTWRGG